MEKERKDPSLTVAFPAGHKEAQPQGHLPWVLSEGESSAMLRHPAYGNLLQQPQETHTRPSVVGRAFKETYLI